MVVIIKILFRSIFPIFVFLYQRTSGKVGGSMQAFYKLPFEAFEKYTPYGTPDLFAAARKSLEFRGDGATG